MMERAEIYSLIMSIRHGPTTRIRAVIAAWQEVALLYYLIRSFIVRDNIIINDVIFNIISTHHRNEEFISLINIWYG